MGRVRTRTHASLSKRQREIVIDRAPAWCGCEYEWGVHVAFFADAVGLSHEQVRSLTSGTPGDDCWEDPTERLLIEAVDSLHDISDIDDELFGRLGAVLSDAPAARPLHAHRLVPHDQLLRTGGTLSTSNRAHRRSRCFGSGAVTVRGLECSRQRLPHLASSLRSAGMTMAAATTWVNAEDEAWFRRGVHRGRWPVAPASAGGRAKRR